MRIRNSLTLALVLGIMISCKNEPKTSKNAETSSEEMHKKNKATESINTADGVFRIVRNASVISWVGSKPAGDHNGQIKLKSGEMHLEDGKLKAAKFIADMTSITVIDLEGEDKIDLENHLKGNIEGKEDHFFNVKEYPESQFTLKSITPNGNMYKVYGELSIKGQSNPIEFNSKFDVGTKKTSVKLISEEFEIDRTKWGIEYMSKSVFDDLKERFINDEITLKVQLKAEKVSS